MIALALLAALCAADARGAQVEAMAGDPTPLSAALGAVPGAPFLAASETAQLLPSTLSLTLPSAPRLFHGALPAAAPLAEPAASREARAFLSGLGTVRVHVPAQKGRGHQAMAGVIMRRLRKLGFHGTLEILYDGETKPELDLFVPGFDPDREDDPDVQELLGLQARAVNLHHLAGGGHYLDHHSEGSVALGLTPEAVAGPDALRVRLLAVAPPWLLKSLATPSLVHTTDVNQDEWMDEKFWSLPFWEPHNPPNLTEWLDRTLLPKSLDAARPGLSALVRALDRVELLPVYSRTLSKDPERSLLVIESAALARTLRPDLFAGPVVSAFFSDLPRELRRMPPMRDIAFTDIRGPDLAERLENPSSSRDLAVDVGPVPQLLFEALASRSRLAPLLDGGESPSINTMALMHLLGRPYLIAGDVPPTLAGMFLRAPGVDKTKFRKLYSDVKAALARKDDDSKRVLADAIIAGRDPDSLQSRGFREGRTREEEDKIAAVIARAAQRLRGAASR